MEPGAGQRGCGCDECGRREGMLQGLALLASFGPPPPLLVELREGLERHRRRAALGAELPGGREALISPSERRPWLPYDPDALLPSPFDAFLLSGACPSIPWRPSDPVQERQQVSACYIVGCGRSGTTVFGDVLSAHEDIVFLNEPRRLWVPAVPALDVWSVRAPERRGRLALQPQDALAAVAADGGRGSQTWVGQSLYRRGLPRYGQPRRRREGALRHPGEVSGARLPDPVPGRRGRGGPGARPLRRRAPAARRPRGGPICGAIREFGGLVRREGRVEVAPVGPPAGGGRVVPGRGVPGAAGRGRRGASPVRPRPGRVGPERPGRAPGHRRRRGRHRLAGGEVRGPAGVARERPRARRAAAGAPALGGGTPARRAHPAGRRRGGAGGAAGGGGGRGAGGAGRLSVGAAALGVRPRAPRRRANGREKAKWPAA
ncbi:unnamed protein product, partial [Prorocentrum cordatum]